MNPVSIITVNFNQYQVNIDFLESIKLSNFKSPIEVIFVDNGSLIEHEKEYKQIYPELIYMRSDKNLGFAGGNNLGIKAATGKYLLLLNNDTEITENLIDVLVNEMEANPEIGLISPLILYFDQPKTIQYAGFSEMNYLTCRNEGIGNMQMNNGQYDQDSRETGYCHGAAMMCRRADLEAVGLMAEEFFLYYEELDWCEKFKKQGKKIWFTGKSKIYHKESMSVGKESKIKTYFMTRNRMLFIRRNTGLLNTTCFSLYYILMVCSRDTLSYLSKGRKDLIKYIYKGLFWNFTNSKNSKNLGFKI
ncbi:glycosyltransferase family 2 protein [Pedobacter fastidiosus]|uniref:Glycosyltransferase family 2 protein n=1 Tax=Pedobacter fastidiosus TaxID=2765361 RepID=A0ABR7KVM4_9SPHI|nr:glycosyltransferase family 2 protein [Pedobacter fastidiosus]MBC6112101.1 glycosyltransferase family 2 protein [Pedobacter fastidiosus]